MTVRRAATSAPDRSPAPDVVAVHVLDGVTLHLTLADGRAGTLDLRWLLDAPAFARLRDPSYLRRAAIAFGTVTWPGGEDLSPESIAARLATGPR
jgi:hypothetical protein